MIKKLYLIIPIVAIAIFAFSKASATDYAQAQNKEEYKNVVKKMYLTQRGSGTINVQVKVGPQFKSEGDPKEYFCKVALEGIEELGAFYKAGLICTGGYSAMNNDYEVYLILAGSAMNQKYYDKIMNFVETESAKMYAKTTDKVELIKLVYDKMNEMISSRHEFFYNSDSPLRVEIKDGYNILASLFYDKFDIENKIIEGMFKSFEEQWNLVKLGDKWYHIYNLPIQKYLVSDIKMSEKYTWDYSAYPKATSDYSVATPVKETAKIVALPKADDIYVPEVGEETKEQPTQPVNDPSEGISSWAKDGVLEAIESGIVPDKLQGNYQKAITREEFSSLVVRLYEMLSTKEITLRPNEFTDTNNIDVIKAYSLRIVSGVGNNKFAPNNNITREQIAVMYDKLLQALNINPSLTTKYEYFADEAEISSWAKASVQKLFKLQILSGVGNSRVNPKGNATIEQAILLSHKLYNLYK